MSRHVPRRRDDPPRGAFETLPFHRWYGCKSCGAVVYDWVRHDCHDHEDQAPPEGYDLASVVERARAEANAEVAEVAEFARPRLFGREAWRQVAACLRLRPPRDPRPAAPDSPITAAGRAEQWARIDALIKRTTEA